MADWCSSSKSTAPAPQTVICGEARINHLCREDKRKIADLVKQIVTCGDEKREVRAVQCHCRVSSGSAGGSTQSNRESSVREAAGAIPLLSTRLMALVQAHIRQQNEAIICETVKIKLKFGRALAGIMSYQGDQSQQPCV